MTKRNEPCPCGSGKKYKKCHMKNCSKGGSPTERRAPAFVPERAAEIEQRIDFRPWQLRNIKGL